MQMYLLWNDDLMPRDENAIVGVFSSREDAEKGWQTYCRSGQYARDIGTRLPGFDRPHTIEARMVGQVQTEPDEGDDGMFG